MRTWLLLGAVVIAAVVVWFFLTDSSDEPIPGRMSNYQVHQDFDPYLGHSDQDTSVDAGAARTGDMPDISSSDDGEEGGESPNRASGEAPETRGDPPLESKGLDPAAARRIADEYLSSAAADPDRLLDRYAERVNYYDAGTVTRSDVLRDKRSYLERWPERSYRRISDVEITDAGAADLIRFTYEFRVSGGSRNAEGRGWAELGVQRSDGAMRIVSERGDVID